MRVGSEQRKDICSPALHQNSFQIEEYLLAQQQSAPNIQEKSKHVYRLTDDLQDGCSSKNKFVSAHDMRYKH